MHLIIFCVVFKKNNFLQEKPSDCEEFTRPGDVVHVHYTVITFLYVFVKNEFLVLLWSIFAIFVVFENKYPQIHNHNSEIAQFYIRSLPLKNIYLKNTA